MDIPLPRFFAIPLRSQLCDVSLRENPFEVTVNLTNIIRHEFYVNYFAGVAEGAVIVRQNLTNLFENHYIDICGLAHQS